MKKNFVFCVPCAFTLLMIFLTIPAWGAMSDEEFIKFCKSGTAQEIQNALRNGANPNARDADGDTALMYVAYNTSDPNVIYDLVKASAIVNAKDDSGLTALHIAAGNNKNPEIIKALINAGADVNARDFHSEDDMAEDLSVLMHALDNENHTEIIKILLDAGADVNTVAHHGETVFSFAMEKNNLSLLNTLLKARNVKQETLDRALWQAAQEIEKSEFVMFMLKAGANINSRNDEGQNLLMFPETYVIDILKTLII